MNPSCKVAIFQSNPTVGDIAGNTEKLVRAIKEALRQNADVFVAPAFALTGSDLDDLIYRPGFWRQINKALDRIEHLDGITIVIGHPEKQADEYFISASVYRDGNRLGIYQQMNLNTHQLCYFSAGFTPLVFESCGSRFGVLMADDLDVVELAAASVEEGAEILLVLDAGAFFLGQHQSVLQNAIYRVEENNKPLIYTNLVGGQDALVYAGGSFVLNQDGQKCLQAAQFEECLSVFNLSELEEPAIEENGVSEEETLYQALVLSIRDYVYKSGFKKVCLGLSGGIDSALVLALAADAIGAENCEVIIMPSPYTAPISVEDAVKMADQMAVKHSTISISPLFELFKRELAPLFHGLPEDLTEENIQARVRGTLLMGLSNKSGALLLSTGNKSEVAMGYCTLYGDMCGGFSPLKDLLKTQVYVLSCYCNQLKGKEIIPERIITRAPSAELRHDQTDQDSLPDYAVLDAILLAIIEGKLSPAEVIAQGFSEEDVYKVVRLLNGSEYKRSQGAIGPRLSRSAFGYDYHMPVCKRFNEVAE